MEGTAKKPSYLGLLNAIALGEGRAHQYLSCWAAKTPDADVRKVIATVAIREGEHSHAFTKRLCELGYTVQDRPDPSFEKNMGPKSALGLPRGVNKLWNHGGLMYSPPVR